MLIDKRPKGLSAKKATELLKQVFTEQTEIFKKLKVDIEESEDSYTIVVKRSKNDPWDRSWTKVLNKLFSDTYTNGWKHTLSKETEQMQVVQEENPFAETVEQAAEGLANQMEETGTTAIQSEVELPDMEEYQTEQSSEIVPDKPKKKGKGTKEEQPELDSYSFPVRTDRFNRKTSNFCDMNDPKLDEYRKKGFDEDQVEQIALGLKAGIDISSYAKKEIHWISMMSARLYLVRQRT